MPQRIMIIGAGGAGKSTLARAVGARLGLPVHHLDALHWHAGWVSTPPDAWARAVAALAAEPRWVIDGNYGGTLDVRLAACDTVVFLDLPRLVCLWGAVRRRWRYAGRARPDMAPGCPERLAPEFLWWIWRYPRTRRPGILRRLAALPPGTQVVVLRSRRAVAQWLASLPTRDATPGAAPAAARR